MHVPDYVASYQQHLEQLIRSHGRDAAMEWVVGGQYSQIGLLESRALISIGLQPAHTLVDVGCGSGRLPFALRTYLTGHFLGTDILEEVLDFAREKCGRGDWRFARTLEPVIPAPDSSADFVSFFSVFTHILDEDIYRFLAEAHRVLRPGGRVVFSFLDFECESHWPIFEATLSDRASPRVINKFISKGSIRRWSRALEFHVDAIWDGYQAWIPLTESFRYTDGRLAEGVVEFGQSVAILHKPAKSNRAALLLPAES